MCISIAPVIFGNTVTGLHEVDENTHAIFYQNVVGASSLPRRSGLLSMTAPPRTSTRTPAEAKRPGNWAIPKKDSGPGRGNALVIPIMTGDFDSIKLLRETAKTPNLLADIRRAVQPVGGRGVTRRKGTLSADGGGDKVVIEQFDIYTLVLASRASLIPDAVKSVASAKRPPLTQEIFDKLEEWYDCPFAVACFSNADSGQSKPIGYAYTPKFAGDFMIYTLDGHDGKVPNLNARVELDHAVFAGSFRATDGNVVHYTDKIPAALQRYVPKKVVGTAFPKGTKLINGDILLSVDDVVEGRFDAYRVVPPNAPARDPIALVDAG